MSDENPWDWMDEPDDDEEYASSFTLYDSLLGGSLFTRTPRFWGSEGYDEPQDNATSLDRVERRAQTIIDQREERRKSSEAAEQREREAAFAQTLADLRELPVTSGVKWDIVDGAMVAVLL